MSQSPERQPEVQKAPFPRDFVEILQKKQGKMVSRGSLVGLGIFFTPDDHIPASVWGVLIRKVDDDHAIFEITVEKNSETSAIHTFRFGFKNQSLVLTEVVLQESGENEMCFEEVLEELQIDEEELKRLVSNAELRGFRTKGGMAFKRKDVLNLKNGTTHEPTIILTDSDQEFGGAPNYSDELILEDSTSDTVINIEDIMGGRGGSSHQEIIFDTTEDYARSRKANIQNLIDLMPDPCVIPRDQLQALFNDRPLSSAITCGIVRRGKLYLGEAVMDQLSPVYVYDIQTDELVAMASSENQTPSTTKERIPRRSPGTIGALSLVVGIGIGAVLSEKMPFLRYGTTTSSAPEADPQRVAEYEAILEQAHAFLNPQDLTLEHCDAALRQWEQNEQHPERAKSMAQWRLARNCVELDQNLQRKLRELMSTGSSATLREINELVNPNHFTEPQVQQALDQWDAPALAQHPDREGSVREWNVHADLLSLQKRVQAFAQREFQVQ